MHQDFRISRPKRDQDTGEIGEPRYCRHNTWVAAAVAAVGAGATIYGANKQAKAVESANNTNAQLQADQNQSAWNSYLLSRGVNPAGATTGQLPTNPQAVNTKLPPWATANFASGPKVWRKKGTATAGPAAGSLVVSGGTPQATAAAPTSYPWGGSNNGVMPQ